ncbi:DUF1232 domain-containing protein [Paenibacillus sp. TRM 82003]|nr:DUF1232 domain-containing protein [Paenibacillus sp. TRM 82003]
MLAKLKAWARSLKRQLVVLYYAYKDERTPWWAKLFAICVVAYALSPIDLIPDFIPVLGYVDDLLLVPLGVMAATKLLPAAVLAEARGKAEQRAEAAGRLPNNWVVGAMIIGLWVCLAGWGIFAFFL